MEQYNVTGMSCAACSARVEKAVKKVPGVTSCSVSLLTNSMGVEGTASEAAILKAVPAPRVRPATLPTAPAPIWTPWPTMRRPSSSGGSSPRWAFCWC